MIFMLGRAEYRASSKTYHLTLYPYLNTAIDDEGFTLDEGWCLVTRSSSSGLFKRSPKSGQALKISNE